MKLKNWWTQFQWTLIPFVEVALWKVNALLTELGFYWYWSVDAAMFLKEVVLSNSFVDIIRLQVTKLGYYSSQFTKLVLKQKIR